MKINYFNLMFLLALAIMFGTAFIQINFLFTSTKYQRLGLTYAGLLDKAVKLNCTTAFLTIKNYDAETGDNEYHLSCFDVTNGGVNLWRNSTK